MLSGETVSKPMLYICNSV